MAVRRAGARVLLIYAKAQPNPRIPIDIEFRSDCIRGFVVGWTLLRTGCVRRNCGRSRVDRSLEKGAGQMIAP